MTLETIRKRADFLAANRGIRVARPGFVLLAQPNGGRGTRFGVTVTKKIGNAVVRNRMKRRFRELLRAALPEAGLPDHDHVLIGREGGIERDFALMSQELAAALARAAAGQGDSRRPSRRGSDFVPPAPQDERKNGKAVGPEERGRRPRVSKDPA